MAALARRRRTLDFWPGFVDALAALLMVMVFVLLIFVIGQFILSDAVSGRDRALSQLNQELAVLARTLSLETQAREAAQSRLSSAESELGELRATLASTQREREGLVAALSEQEAESARLLADISALERLKQQLESDLAQQITTLERSEEERIEKTELSERALAQVELLNRQIAEIRTQLEELNQALASAREGLDARDLKIEELGRELNLALASRVQELNRYRSEFFGRLRAILGQRSDVQIVGDRFVFSSEVLFPSASDEVSEEGLRQLLHLADTLRQLATEIPADLPWVLQVDGHTDRRPIATARFPSNWELSSARALAIVKFLRDQGVPAQRLAATGYGEYHPLDPADTPEAWARNRRIELKLTSR